MAGTVSDVRYLVEGLDFVIRELELTALFSRFGGDDFARRTLARHAIIRAEDVAKLARRLRKHVNASGGDFSNALSVIELYESEVSGPLTTTRNRLAAHVQDLEFLQRLDLWDAIDLDLVQSCHGRALAVRSAVANAGVLFDDYTSHPEVYDEALLERLGEYQESTRPDALVRMRADPLAARRPNSTTILNGSPSHQRAAQANLLIKWLQLQDDLLVVADSKNITSILRCRWATDLVSLVDALFTRDDNEGDHRGLDTILEMLPYGDATRAVEFLRQFSTARNTSARVLPLRSLRNGFGAHVDVRPDRPIELLCKQVDDLDWVAAANLFKDLVSAFRKVCREAMFLQAYAMEDVAMHGISSGTPGDVKHFDPNQPDNVPRLRLEGPIDDDVVRIQLAVERWVESDTEDSAERHLLWNALRREGLKDWLTR